MLMIGPSRDVGRDRIVDKLAPFRTGAKERPQAKPLFIVATQCVEVGVDLDLDGLVTQAASLDALRQRFGRLNRAGRQVPAEGRILACAEDIAKKSRRSGLRRPHPTDLGGTPGSCRKRNGGLRRGGVAEVLGESGHRSREARGEAGERPGRDACLSEPLGPDLTATDGRSRGRLVPARCRTDDRWRLRGVARGRIGTRHEGRTVGRDRRTASTRSTSRCRSGRGLVVGGASVASASARRGRA